VVTRELTGLNVVFGDPDRRTLFITATGFYAVEMAVRGQ